MIITYKMNPIDNGTRLRTDHNTFSQVITSFNETDVLTGDELWIAPADGAEVKKDDKWLHVTHKNDVELSIKGWTAYIHKGILICENFVTNGEPNPEPEPTPIFPESFILTDPQGNQAEYEFVRIVE